jgi:(2Fe-2S) ferredoxin
MGTSPTMFVLVDGVWHQANPNQTATLCGLDPDDVEEVVEGRLRAGATLCPKCAKAGSKE